MPKFDLEEHLRTEHKRSAFSQYLREIVYGGNDGIVTTFAVVAGFAGAQQDPAVSTVPIISVLLFGLANLFADGLSMALGSFLSLRAEQDVYKSEKIKEHHEILHEPESEFAETIEILKRKRFSEKDANILAGIYRKNPHYWTEFMMKDELDMPNPENEKPSKVALSTFLAFTGFGIIPLVPFMLKATDAFVVSVWFTAFALLMLGFLRATITRRRALRSVLETLFVGGTSASVAYLVGTLFRV